MDNKRRLINLITSTFLVLVPALAEKKDPLIIKHADRFEYLDKNGVKYQKLIGNVKIHYKDTKSKSDTAIHFHNQDKIEFIGNAKLDFKTQYLEADRIIYFKRDSSARAMGNVVLYDKERRVRITGGRGSYSNENEESRIWDKPVFTRIDTNGQDTLTIVSREMKHFGKTEKAVAIDDVVITQDKVRALSEIAEYYKDKEMALLIGAPKVFYEKNILTGDSIRLFFKDEALDKIRVVGNAVGNILEENKANPDSAKVSIISGDTLIAYIHANAIDHMKVIQHAVGINYVKCDSLNVNRLTGKYMEFFFSDNAVDSTYVFGNATSIYYYDEEGAEKGRNETSGDSLNIYFHQNKVSRIVARGGVKGVYYNE